MFSFKFAVSVALCFVLTNVGLAGERMTPGDRIDRVGPREPAAAPPAMKLVEWAVKKGLEKEIVNRFGRMATSDDEFISMCREKPELDACIKANLEADRAFREYVLKEPSCQHIRDFDPELDSE